MKSKQLEAWRYLQDKNYKQRLIHGGGPTKGRRKEFRPLSTRDSLHLVLRASCARRAFSLLHKNHRTKIHAIIKKQAARFHVHIRNYANVGNHLHLEVQIAARAEFQNFLRSVTCLIARMVTGARRGRPFGRKFWDHLAFTRVLKSFKEQTILFRYIWANSIEGELGPFARARFLEAWYGKEPPSRQRVIGHVNM